jgi:fructose/tagatose bisphosphate aldolase
MALISLRQLLDHAAEHGYGVPAFNVNNMEQMRAIMEAADETDSPVIVQASAGARKNGRISPSSCTRTTVPAPPYASVRFSSVSPRS